MQSATPDLTQLDSTQLDSTQLVSAQQASGHPPSAPRPLHRRGLTQGLLLAWATLLASPVAAAEPPPGKPLGLGDEGFDHQLLHDDYQTFFAGKCPCSLGECRPTKVRALASVPDTGMEVLIDGVWYPVPKDAVQLRSKIPAELLVYPAHVCARSLWMNGTLQPKIECVVFNGAI